MLRNKLFSFLSSLLALSLSPDITAFDSNNLPVSKMGEALEDIYEKAQELDGGDNKKELFYFELMKQGTIFIENIWDERVIIDKDSKEYDGKFRNIEIKTKKTKQPGELKRNIISGKSVFLGDLTKYNISDQPYIYTVRTEGRRAMEEIYGGFEMWKYVPEGIVQLASHDNTDSEYKVNGWTLYKTEADQVEVIKYQDKINNEYQTFINGIPMYPIGCPLPWGYREYNIVQQNFKPIRHDFAYGKSFIAENENLIKLLDEMKKLALLKTQKSFMPPYLNMSGRTVSQRIFMPGKITSDVAPGQIVPINEKESQGVTTAEFNIIQSLTKEIDEGTLSPAFTGQKEQGEQTATEILVQQRQSKIMMGVTTLAVSMLEKKLATQGIMILLSNWFNKKGTRLDKAKDEIKDKYRLNAIMMPIQGEGKGVRLVIPSDEVPSSAEIRGLEDQMKEKVGMPVRMILLNPKELRNANLIWNIEIVTKEKKTSELNKLLFDAFLQRLSALGLTNRLNWEHIQERIATMWDEDPDKMFVKTAMPVGMEQPGGQPQQGQGVQTLPGSPQLQTPKGSME